MNVSWQWIESNISMKYLWWRPIYLLNCIEQDNLLFCLLTIFICLCMITFLDSNSKHILSWDEFLRVSVNPLRPRDAYMHQWTVPSLFQIMACHLFGAKPLSEPMLAYFQFSHMHKEHISTKSYLNCKCFYQRKCSWKSCFGLNVFTHWGLWNFWGSLLSKCCYTEKDIEAFCTPGLLWSWGM